MYEGAQEDIEEAVRRRNVDPAERWALESLFLVLTTGCNLRCSYCYNSRVAPARMRWQTAEAAVRRLWASPERHVRLLMTGGEPLLDFALVRRLIEFVRATMPRGRTVTFDLLTNGTRLREEQIVFLARQRVAVQISFDGVEAAQRLRGVGTFRRLDALVRHLRARHRSWFRNRVNAAVTLVPETVPHLADSIDYLLDSGFADITLSPASGDVRGCDDGLFPILEEQFRRVYRSSLQHYRRTGRVPLSLFRKTSASRQPPSYTWCGVDTGQVAVVDVDGQVYGCLPVVGSALHRPEGLLRAARDAVRIGHISDPDLARRLPSYRQALDATGLFDRRDAYYSSCGACEDCRYLPYCHTCPASIALAPGATDSKRVPDFTCAFNRASLKYRHRFPLQRDA